MCSTRLVAKNMQKIIGACPHNKPVSAIDESYLANTLEQSVCISQVTYRLGYFYPRASDSATVANVALKTSQSPVHTFTLALEEQEYNEATMARRIAAAIGTQYQVRAGGVACAAIWLAEDAGFGCAQGLERCRIPWGLNEIPDQADYRLRSGIAELQRQRFG